MREAWQEALDDPATLAGADPGGMMGHVERFGAMLEAAWQAPLPASLPAEARRVLIGGLGGSAIAGSILAGLAAGQSTRVILPVRAYQWPAVDAADLLVVCSFSGETEESLALYEQALGLEPPLVTLSSGGRLAALAAERGTPHLSLGDVPAGLTPRAALPLMLGRLLALLGRLGEPMGRLSRAPDVMPALAEMHAACAPSEPAAANPAKSLALALGEARPVFTALAPAFDGVALRLRCQFEENAKMSAMERSLPELHHNSWVPWLSGDPGGTPIWLGEAEAHPRVRLRRRLSDAALAERGIAALSLAARGESLPARVLTSLLAGDYLSVYHALMRGIDPTPTAPLAAMKLSLRERRDDAWP